MFAPPKKSIANSDHHTGSAYSVQIERALEYEIMLLDFCVTVPPLPVSLPVGRSSPTLVPNETDTHTHILCVNL